jgi:hypothetical protein
VAQVTTQVDTVEPAAHEVVSYKGSTGALHVYSAQPLSVRSAPSTAATGQLYDTLPFQPGLHVAGTSHTTEPVAVLLQDMPVTS